MILAAFLSDLRQTDSNVEDLFTPLEETQLDGFLTQYSSEMYDYEPQYGVDI